jgi:hypothetical protein
MVAARSSVGSMGIGGGGMVAARSSVGSMGIGGGGMVAARSSVGGGGHASRVSYRSGTDSAGSVSNARLMQGQGLVKPTLAAPTYVIRGADTRHLM